MSCTFPSLQGARFHPSFLVFFLLLHWCPDFQVVRNNHEKCHSQLVDNLSSLECICEVSTVFFGASPVSPLSCTTWKVSNISPVVSTVSPIFEGVLDVFTVSFWVGVHCFPINASNHVTGRKVLPFRILNCYSQFWMPQFWQSDTRRCLHICSPN